MKSFWEEDSTPLEFKALEENKTTDDHKSIGG